MKDQEEFSIEDLCRLIVWSTTAAKTKTEVAAALSEIGFSSGKISRLLGIPSNAVSALLNQAKKSKKNRP